MHVSRQGIMLVFREYCTRLVEGISGYHSAGFRGIMLFFQDTAPGSWKTYRIIISEWFKEILL